MECACIDVDLDSDEISPFHREVKQIARKEHKCDECGRIISPGEKYEYAVNKWYGDLCVNKTCCDCLSVREAFFCTWYYGGIWEELDEYLEPGECLSKALLEVTPAAREKISRILDEKVEDSNQ